jgi:hypothetical protein
MELALFRHFKSQNIVCILNDITNSLRHGDITSFKGGVPTIMEVKSGCPRTNDARTRRQVERASRILKYMKEDQGQGVYPGQGTATLHRRELTIDESHHRDKLTELLMEALAATRNVTRTIERGLYYNVSVLGQAGVESLNQIPNGGRICAIFVNPGEYVGQAYYPFALSITNPEAVFDFYNNRCLITVVVDSSVIEHELVKAGIEMAFNEDSDNEFLSLQSRDSGLRVGVSRHFFNRIAVEFLSLEWLISELIGFTRNAGQCIEDIEGKRLS